MKSLAGIIRKERASFTVYPASDDVFKAFQLCSLDDTRVVIIGQDPYPHAAANGLAFSMHETYEKVPASLKNIFKEIETDVGFKVYHDPNLERWATQGVLLLNTVLTVRAGEINSHKGIGWETFTSNAIRKLCKYKTEPIVFILWGIHAMGYIDVITAPHHYICSTHPSPMSAHKGFFDSRPFSRTNEFLKYNNMKPIDW